MLAGTSVWIDLFNPSPEEEQAVESALGMGVPTRQEMQAIELSSRLYKERDVLFMTATVLTKADTSHPESSAVTFILAPDRLITVRYTDPVPFRAFRARREANFEDYDTPPKVLVGIIDAVIERLADILESTGAGIDAMSLEIFRPDEPSASAAAPGQRDYQEILRRVGRHSDLSSRARESLVSLGRLISFFRETAKKDSPGVQDALAHLQTVSGDLSSLSDHASFLSGKIAFLLDATLGLINNEQNGIIKIVSVAAVVFLPPTLVASIYGMNFEAMPELRWLFGYPLALGMMVISAILPYAFFKRKRWL